MNKRISKIIEKNRSVTWMDTSEALNRLAAGGVRITAPTLLSMIRRGDLIGKRIGKKFFITVESIETLLEVKK